MLTRSTPLRLLSSDIFDTALFRLVGRPDSAYFVLGARLHRRGIWTLEPRIFAVQRGEAELTEGARAGSDQPRLDDVYRNLSGSRWLTNADAAMQMELDLERSLLRPSARHAHHLRAARAAGQRVCFTSDTYFSEAFLREALGALVDPADALYASCERGASKRQGKLFSVMLATEGVEPAEVLHIGDHPVSDGSVPSRHGLVSVLSPAPLLDPCERILESHAAATDGASSLLAGAMRWIRTSASESDRFDSCGSESAPLVVAFATWALDRADRARCDRLEVCGAAASTVSDILSTLDAAWPGGSSRRVAVDTDTARDAVGIRIVAPSGADRLLSLTLDGSGVTRTSDSFLDERTARQATAAARALVESGGARGFAIELAVTLAPFVDDLRHADLRPAITDLLRARSSGNVEHAQRSARGLRAPPASP